MKEVKAIVKKFKVNDILTHLLNAGFPNITVATAEGTGSFKDIDPSLSTHFSITDSEVAVICIICENSDVENIVNIISRYGRTGNPGDGLIYVTPVEKTFRVKTGLENEEV